MRLYGLIGFPITHSFSPKYFAEKFKVENILDAEYRLFPIADLRDLPKLLASHPDIAGLNVTIPHKVNILPFLDEISEEATEIGAVNTIAIQSGKLIGYNTDVFGFEVSLMQLLNKQTNISALILGTGGASMAVSFVLRKLRIPYHLVSRSDKHSLTYQQLTPDIIAAHQLIINTTPVGMSPNTHDSPLLRYEGIGSSHYIYDLIYNPPVTQLMRSSALLGAHTLNGLMMLHQQAEHAWQIWQKH